MMLISIVGFTIFLVVSIDINNVEAKMTLAQVRNSLKPFHKACLPKSGVSPDVWEATHNGEFPPDPALQCHFACLFTKLKILTKDGKLSMESMAKQMDIMLPEDLVGPIKSITDKCAVDATSSEVCEMSWQFAKCYYEADADMYFLP
ncbi:hypothetical protein HCN44_007894 [Aphidius gifuensis]|uniref:Odorant-binding protein n=1 Tax=Aphidius gifuensis TaxID=684658 RepID=A0A3S9LWD6_APHGI|nr:general odorant-binding protein 83a-like [Aphidius gifuensis]AZQ24995.1 odorant-binding protein [Aphidius gifuensis]KAF7993391.1 hypothetical protein HCN44_007894 [Aphidius gifuensis]